MWTSHISRACIAGPTSKSASINLKCKVSFSGGIDPNYPGGFSESSCSGGDFHDETVQVSISAGEQRACEVVYETPCLDNEIECEEI